jgi:hypothetical protein
MSQQTIFLVSNGNWDAPYAWATTYNGTGTITNPQNGSGTTYDCDLNGGTVVLNVPVVVDLIHGGTVAAAPLSPATVAGPHGSQIVLLWSPYPGATSYDVWVAKDPNDNTYQIGSSANTFFAWTANIPGVFQFTIVAETGAGNFLAGQAGAWIPSLATGTEVVVSTAQHLGAIPTGQTVCFGFSIRLLDQTLVNLGCNDAETVVTVLRDDDPDGTTAGVTLSTSFGDTSGLNMVQIATTDEFYAPGHGYLVVLTSGMAGAGGLGTSVAGTILASFSIESSSAPSTLTPDERNAVADALLDRAAAIDGKTPREAMRIATAVLAGKIDDAGTGEETFVGLDGTTARAVVTVNATGNRTDVQYP